MWVNLVGRNWTGTFITLGQQQMILSRPKVLLLPCAKDKLLLDESQSREHKEHPLPLTRQQNPCTWVTLAHLIYPERPFMTCDPSIGHISCQDNSVK